MLISGIAKRSLSLAEGLRGVTVAAIGVVAFAFQSFAVAQTATPVNVPIWRFDNANSGMNLQETLLTPANVNSTSFGKLFSYAVDGYVYAQPLYVSGLTMPDGKAHNVLFVATEHDSVYAFDADSDGGSNAFPLWHASLLTTAYGAASGATTVPAWELGAQDIVPEQGITGTPVIDVTAKTLFVVAKTWENGAIIQRLHALNIVTGAEQSYGPSTPLTATVPGTGNGSSDGSLTFSSFWQNQRPGLALFNGYVYVAWGSVGDDGPWHGWIMAFNEQTLTQSGAMCLSPNGYGNGIWASGAGLPIDTITPNGRLFAVAGNGDYTSYPPVSSSVDYSNSVLRFDLTGGLLTPTDAFTPFNQATLTATDVDQGSGGILMLPDQAGAYPHELVQVGKEGRILVLDRDDLGGYAPGGASNTNAVQDIDGQLTGGMWGTPVYWNGHVFFWGVSDYLKRFELTNGSLSLTPSSIGNFASAFPAPTPVVSSNGTSNGVLWAIRADGYNSSGSAILYAYDPTNLTAPLYESDTNASDDGGPAVKFTVPVVTNGKVYTGAAYQVNVYGLLNGQTKAAAPTITPNGGSFGGAQQVALSTTTPNATMYFTTDGSLPTAASTAYTAPFTLTTDTTVRAIASAQNFLQSPVTNASFNFVTQTPAPTFSPVAGSYTSTQTVTISDSVAGATIYYTIDGSTPTTSSAVYSAPITVSYNETVNALAVSGTLTPSNVAGAVYSIQVGGSGIDFGSGFAEVNGLTLNGSAISTDDSRLQLTNGGYNEAGSVFGNTPMNITSFVNDFLFELSDAAEYGFTFTIQNQGPTALGPPTSGLGYGASLPGYPLGIPNSIAIKFDFYNTDGEGTDSTGLYENGASPTIPAIDMTSSGVILSSGDIIQAHMTYNGTNLVMTLYDSVVNARFTQSFPVNIPQVIGSNTAYVGFTGGTGFYSASQKILTWTFVSEAGTTTSPPVISPSGGSFSTPQQVSITDSTVGAVIYYTIDGSTPTTSSPVYSTPFTIAGGTVTVNAMAIGLDGNQSTVASAVFAVGESPAAAPLINPGSGSYIGPLSVTLSDATPGASIYYTTDGSNPSTSNTAALYSGPITVSISETVNAIATAPNYTPSTLATSVFSIYTAGQSINYSAGFTSASGLALNGSAKLYAPLSALELNDGNSLETGSAWATTPVNTSGFVTDFIFQMVNPGTEGFTFALQNSGTNALGAGIAGLGYGAWNGVPGIPKSVALKFDIYSNAGEGNDSIGVYTGGAAPTLPATDLTGTGIVLTSGDVFHAHLVYNGSILQVTITDNNTSATYTTNFTVNIPAALGSTEGYAGFTGSTGQGTVTTSILYWTFSSINESVTSEPAFTPAPGTYGGPIGVTLGDLTANSTIYYTFDGSQPSYSSQVYSAPIQVSGVSLTIKAFASSPGLADSPIVTGTYTMGKTTPVITWPAPAPISCCTPIGATQLNATASVAGTFAYSIKYISGPANGAVLPPGTWTLIAAFTPTDTTDYTTATANVSLTITKGNPAISWSAPATIQYGTLLGAKQLNAKAAVNGSFTYTPPSGTLLGVGSYTLSTTLTPTSAADYNTATATVPLTVKQATPVITWATPAPISCCNPITATQLNATASVPGTFTYSWNPGSMSILPPGSWKLTASFTPTDAVDYTTATASVILTINKGNPVIVWNPPAAITYGTALTYLQLGAKSSTSGTFAYTPVYGTMLQAGSYTLSTTLTPTSTADYNSAAATVPLTVNPASLNVTANNMSVPYGSAMPSLTYKMSGFVNGDSAATATTGAPSLSTAATSQSAPGTYPITAAPGSLAASNYGFKFANGTLTITPAGQAAKPVFHSKAATDPSKKTVTITDRMPGHL
jgi:hypothetical protein